MRAAEQQPGDPPGREIVGTDEGLAHGPGDVREQRHDMHAGAHEVIDRELDRRHVGPEQRNAVAVRELGEFRRERARVGGFEAVRDFGDVRMAEVRRALGDLAVDHVEESQPRRRQHESEAIAAYPRPTAAGAAPPRSRAAAFTRSIVSALTPGRLFSTRSTVAVLTPAASAIWAMVIGAHDGCR